MKRLIALLLLLVMAAVPLMALATEPTDPTNSTATTTTGDTGSTTTTRWDYPPPWVQERWFRDRDRDCYRDRWHYGPIVSPDGMYYVNGFWINNRPAVITPAEPAQPQYGRASYGDITWSTEYLKQGWANNRNFDLRLYQGNDRIVYKESFGPGENSGVRMTLFVNKTMTGLKPVYTDEALDFLEDLGVTEILVATKNEETVYTIEQLRAGI